MSTIFIRQDDPSGENNPIVNSHQVWDAEKFLASQIAQYSGEKDPKTLRIISVVDEAAYRSYKGYKGYTAFH